LGTGGSAASRKPQAASKYRAANHKPQANTGLQTTSRKLQAIAVEAELKEQRTKN
jgi:hypothetical protein